MGPRRLARRLHSIATGSPHDDFVHRFARDDASGRDGHRSVGEGAKTLLVRIKALARAHGARCLIIDPVSTLSTLADTWTHLSYLVLELTESRVMAMSSAPQETLVRLRMQRFGLSIDDFGTGHSSLAQLRDVPFTELKIDRGFVHGAGHNPLIRPMPGDSMHAWLADWLQKRPRLIAL